MERRRTKEVARRIVAEMAPEELAAFELRCQAYFDDPVRFLRGDKHRKDPLGSGFGVLVFELTGPALYIADRVLGVVVDKEVTRLGKRLRPLLRRRRQSPVSAAPAPGVRSAVEIAGAERGLSAEAIEAVVRIVVRELSPAESADVPSVDCSSAGEEVGTVEVGLAETDQDRRQQGQSSEANEQ